jgi:hypothetical protein
MKCLERCILREVRIEVPEIPDLDLHRPNLTRRARTTATKLDLVLLDLTDLGTTLQNRSRTSEGRVNLHIAAIARTLHAMDATPKINASSRKRWTK